VVATLEVERRNFESRLDEEGQESSWLLEERGKVMCGWWTRVKEHFSEIK
jgi:hypothetical protein